MSEKHDYASALDALEIREDLGRDIEASPADILGSGHTETIRHALRFAEKMMQEPREDMKLSGLRALVRSIVSKNWTNEQLLNLSEEDRRHYKEMDAHRAIQTSDEAIAVFKAMRDAALKELGEEVCDHGE